MIPYDLEKNDKGNIFALLFAAVAMVGVLGVVGMQTISGPVRTITKVTQKNIMDTDLLTNARIIIMDAGVRDFDGNGDNLEAGDPDSDNYIEPVPFDSTCTKFPTGGGCLPTDVGVIRTDPWGTEYGYCVWDHGSVNSSVGRLDGEDDTAAIVIAVISAGANKTFETTCTAYDGVLGADAIDAIISPSAEGGGDDAVRLYTYDAAVAGSGGLWSIKAGDAATAVIDKKLEVGTYNPSGGTGFAFDATSGEGDFPYLKTGQLSQRSGSNKVQMVGGLQLDDEAEIINAECASLADAGVVRWNTAGNIDVCNGTSFINVGASDRIIDADGDTYIDVDTAGDGSANTIVMTATDGVNSRPSMTIDPANKLIRFQTEKNPGDGVGTQTGGFEMQSTGTNNEERILRIYSTASNASTSPSGNRPTTILLESMYRNIANYSYNKGENSIVSKHTAQDNTQKETSALVLGVTATGVSSSSLAGHIAFETLPAAGSLTERMRITDDGDVAMNTDGFYFDKSANFVGLGTASPSAKLHLTGTGIANGIVFDDGATLNGLSRPVSGGFEFTFNGTPRLSIGSNSVSTNTGHGYTISATQSRTFTTATGYDTGIGGTTALDFYADPVSGNPGMSLINEDDLTVGGFVKLGTGSCGASEEGAIQYETVGNTVQYCNGTAWADIASTATIAKLRDIGNVNISSDPTDGYILQWDNTGKTWDAVNPTGLAVATATSAGKTALLIDSDNDTSINVDTAGNGSANTIIFSSNGTQRMIIDSAGDVGIGTMANPTSTLYLKNATGDPLLTFDVSSLSNPTAILFDNLPANRSSSIIWAKSGGGSRAEIVANTGASGVESYLGLKVGNGLKTIFRLWDMLDTKSSSAATLAYTVNKPTSGDDTGLTISKTDTASTGISLLINGENQSVTQFSIDDAGAMYLKDSLVIGNVTKNTAAILQADSTTKGFLPPRVADAGGLASPTAGLMAFDTGSSDMEFYDGAGWRTMDAGAATSDARLKENLTPIEGSLDKLSTLRTVEYDWIDKTRGDNREMGIIAQDIEKVFPLLVSTDGNGYLQVDYRRLTVPLIDAVKTLKQENNDLRLDIDTLSKKMDALDVSKKSIQTSTSLTSMILIGFAGGIGLGAGLGLFLLLINKRK